MEFSKLLPIFEMMTDNIIDLRGPQGNAFYLLGLAKRIGQELDWHESKIQEMLTDMKSGDYENLLHRFDQEFGCIFTIIK